MTKFLFIALVFLGLSFRASACSCPNDYAFCYTVNDWPNDLVVTGVITSMQDTTSLRLNILEAFKGTEANDTITVWGGLGGDCNGWVSMATHHIGSVGDTVVIILQRITPNNLQNPWDLVGDYRRLSDNCYHPWLQVNNGMVYGRIMGSYMFGPPPWSVDSMTYSDFQAAWTGENMYCPINLATAEEIGQQIFTLSPNPASETIVVNFTSSDPEGAIVQLYDFSGRLVTNIGSFYNGQAISVADLPSGIYLVSATGASGKRIQQKLVVQR